MNHFFVVFKHNPDHDSESLACLNGNFNSGCGNCMMGYGVYWTESSKCFKSGRKRDSFPLQVFASLSNRSTVLPTACENSLPISLVTENVKIRYSHRRAQRCIHFKVSQGALYAILWRVKGYSYGPPLCFLYLRHRLVVQLATPGYGG